MNLTEIKAIIASIEPAEDETDRLRQYAAVLNEIPRLRSLPTRLPGCW